MGKSTWAGAQRSDERLGALREVAKKDVMLRLRRRHQFESGWSGNRRSVRQSCLLITIWVFRKRPIMPAAEDLAPLPSPKALEGFVRSRTPVWLGQLLKTTFDDATELEDLFANCWVL